MPKLSKSTRELLRSAGTGRDARNFLMRVMSDESEDMDRRIDAAKCLMPYQYAKVLPKAEKDAGLSTLAAVLIQYAG